MDSDQHDIRYVNCLDENWVEVRYRAKDECEELNVNTNVFIAAFTTCWARLRLYEALELLGNGFSITTQIPSPTCIVPINLTSPSAPLSMSSLTNLNPVSTLRNFVRAGPNTMGTDAMMIRQSVKSRDTL